VGIRAGIPEVGKLRGWDKRQKAKDSLAPRRKGAKNCQERKKLGKSEKYAKGNPEPFNPEPGTLLPCHPERREGSAVGKTAGIGNNFEEIPRRYAPVE
jgi:hypothetical protein